MKKIILSALVATSLLSANETKYEVSILGAHVDTKEHKTFENHNAIGLTFGLKRGDDCKFDVTEFGIFHSSDENYVRSNNKTDISRVFVNQVKEYEIVNKTKLYALVGLGYEKSNSLSENDPYFNYGVGVKYSFNDTVGLRTDARHMLRFDGMKHVMYTAGLTISFGANNKTIDTPKENEVTQTKAIKVDLDSDNDGVLDINDNCPSSKSGIKVNNMGCAIILDSDYDGVSNENDRCYNTPKGTKVNKNGCKIQDDTITSPENLNINFKTNSGEIEQSDLNKFKKYVSYLNEVPSSKVSIDAYTDSLGSASYNKALSIKRANSAKKILISMGISEDRIITVGHGEDNPLTTNDTAKNRQKNRRVTAKIIK